MPAYLSTDSSSVSFGATARVLDRARQDLEADHFAGPRFAVDSQVEESEFAHPVLYLKTDSECPGVPELERCLLAYELALVPWLATSDVGRDALPSS